MRFIQISSVCVFSEDKIKNVIELKLEIRKIRELENNIARYVFAGIKIFKPPRFKLAQLAMSGFNFVLLYLTQEN